MTTIRIATRGSRQATAQSEHVASRLRAAGFDTELVLVETLGDRTQADNVPLHAIGGQGVFVKEVQRAVLDGRADVAVHSAKDLPATDADGLEIAAFLARRSVADVLLRRTPIGLHACQGLDCLDTIADHMSALLGWDHHERERQIEAYRRELAPMRRFSNPIATPA